MKKDVPKMRLAPCLVWAIYLLSPIYKGLQHNFPCSMGDESILVWYCWIYWTLSKVFVQWLPMNCCKLDLIYEESRYWSNAYTRDVRSSRTIKKGNGRKISSPLLLHSDPKTLVSSRCRVKTRPGLSQDSFYAFEF